MSWYANRLRAMSPREIGWRARQVAGERLPGPGPRIRFGNEAELTVAYEAFRSGQGRPVLLDRERAARIAVDHPRETADLIRAADDAVIPKVAYFGYPPVQLARPVDWHHDPLAGVRWPAVPEARIDYRAAAGDVKWIWELNRLQHVPLLSEAWLFTGDDGYAAAAFEQLDGWLQQNPLGSGIAWKGAFEAGVRAISVALAVQGLRESPLLTRERFAAVAALLSESAHRCWTRRSLYSSANNHLIGEMTGLATVAILLPELPRSAVWERRALQVLRTHLDRQILPDGCGAEQSATYQVSTAEYSLLVDRLLKLRDGYAPPEFAAAAARGARFLSAIAGSSDPVPRFGDDDDSFALRLGAESKRTLRQHLTIVGAVCGDATLSALGEPTLAAAWLADSVPDPSEVPDPPVPAAFYAPHGGVVVLRSHGRRVTVDVGALGMGTIAAHGHADALSVTLAIDGEEIIGDPGVGSYYGKPEIRQLFRGTRAHPTVTVDGLDQSVVAGPFLWSRHAHVRVHEVDLSRGIVDASHDGYERLADPVTHRRVVIASPTAPEVVIIDVLQGSGDHRVELSWPLAPGLSVERCEHGFLIAGRAQVSVTTVATAALRHRMFDGAADDGIVGWSHRLEQLSPSVRLSSDFTGRLPFAAVTVLGPGGSYDPCPSLEVAGGALTAGWHGSGGDGHQWSVSLR